MAGPANSAALAKRFGGMPVEDVAPEAPAPIENPTFDGSVLFDPSRKPASTEDFRIPTAFENVAGTLKDTGIGAAKGAFHSLMQLAELASKSQMVPGISPFAGDIAQHGVDATPYTNTAQKVGGGLETVAEMVLPGMAGTKAVPSATRAGALFQDVMGAAKNVAVDTADPGNVALRIQQLAERGGSMPMAVRKFINRVTDPAKADLTYEEARDFASNISRLSVDETKRLTPVVRMEVANMRVALNEAIAKAAQKAGKGAEYKTAMKEYAQAMRMRDMAEQALKGAKKAAPWLTAGGAASWLGSKLSHLGGD